VDACLRRLDVDHVPLLVLTHFHADHVGGLTGVLEGRTVDQALVSPVADPPAGAADAGRQLAAARVSSRSPAYGETLVVGPVRAQVLWPPARAPTMTEGSLANNASLVLLVEVRGVRMLLTGDIEPPAQGGLSRTLQGVTIDVLKLPHHGSRAQDLDFLAGLRPRVVLVSVGADNDYGHPAPEALTPFEAAGATVLRTDQAGDLAVIDRDGELVTSSR
jgi:competence protein ComEC